MSTLAYNVIVQVNVTDDVAPNFAPTSCDEPVIYLAVDELQEIVRDSIPDIPLQFSIEKTPFAEGDECGDFVLLVVRAPQATRDQRKAARVAAHQFLAKSPWRSVRERLVVNFR